LPIVQFDAHVDVGVLFEMQVCQHPSMAPLHTGSAAPAQSASHEQPAWQVDDVSHAQPPPQSVSQAQPDWQLDDVSQAQPPPQSGSHEQDASQVDAVSHAQPPACSHRMSTVSHARPLSQPPPLVQAQPSAPTAQLAPSSPEHAATIERRSASARTNLGIERWYLTRTTAGNQIRSPGLARDARVAAQWSQSGP
jgi:hypothetical protein